MPEGLTVQRLLKKAEEKLSTVSHELARRDAEIMLAHLLDTSLSRLPLYEQSLSHRQVDQFKSYVGRRQEGEPVAYIIGEQEFWSLTFKVNEHTLVPRPDTETLVEVGLQQLPHAVPTRILDLGTGSGCILLSLLHERAEASGVGVDKSSNALVVAKMNSDQLGLTGRCQLREGDWYQALHEGEQFDLIVSNPPYIQSSDMQTLMSDVREHEPHSALDGGVDGLDCYRRIAADVASFLCPGGTIAVEVGIGQDQDVAGLFVETGLEAVSTHVDLAGVKRVVAAKKAAES